MVVPHIREVRRGSFGSCRARRSASAGTHKTVRRSHRAVAQRGAAAGSPSEPAVLTTDVVAQLVTRRVKCHRVRIRGQSGWSGKSFGLLDRLGPQRPPSFVASAGSAPEYRHWEGLAVRGVAPVPARALHREVPARSPAASRPSRGYRGRGLAHAERHDSKGWSALGSLMSHAWGPLPGHQWGFSSAIDTLEGEWFLSSLRCARGFPSEHETITFWE